MSCSENDTSSETESIFTCNECKKIITREDIKFQCYDCEEYFCDNCQDEIEEMNTCSINNCYYCSRGRCFNNRVLHRYCIDCVPQEVLDDIEERENEEKEAFENYKKIEFEMPTRYNNLKNALELAGLELRQDSKLCEKYINNGDGEIEFIVQRMCQMKFLFEYCDMRNVLKKVEQEHVEILEEGYFPDCSVFVEAEDRVLETNNYPDIFPWQLK